jgi:hypothetical protein
VAPAFYRNTLFGQIMALLVLAVLLAWFLSISNINGAPTVGYKPNLEKRSTLSQSV